ncbi:MAG: glycerol uptake facilitator protein [Algoriphagus sp.]
MPSTSQSSCQCSYVFCEKTKPKETSWVYFLSNDWGIYRGWPYLSYVGDAIAVYESGHGFLRGSVDSYHSAMMFGEFFPNPGFESKLSVSIPLACFMEALGTFILVFVIFRLTEKPEQMDNLTPILIGLTVSLIICLVAPFTQAGLNPARDFGPRMVAYFAGWGKAAFPLGNYSFISVYMLSPIFGGLGAMVLHKFFIKHSES